jgi:multiple sugar transport system permease protein
LRTILSGDSVSQAESTRRPHSKSTLARFWDRNKYAYLFLAPWLIGLLLFSIIPIVSSLYLSFTNYDLFTAPEWIGGENFIHMWTRNPRFLKALNVTFRYVLIGVPLQLITALALALVLNRGIRGLPFFRGAFYIPSLLGGSVAIAILWRRLFGFEGSLNQLLAFLGLQPDPPISYVSNPHYALYTLIVLHMWQFGSPMIIFLAGLKQIPAELYEAASIDGANRRTSFFSITLPMLTPIIFFNLVLQIISAFQAFTPAYIVGGGTTGGPLDSLLFYTLYLYFLGFVEFRMGYAAAMAWMLLLIIAIFTALLFFSSRWWVFYGDER